MKVKADKRVLCLQFVMALSNPLHGERKAGFVGKPLPGVQVARFLAAAMERTCSFISFILKLSENTWSIATNVRKIYESTWKLVDGSNFSDAFVDADCRRGRRGGRCRRTLHQKPCHVSRVLAESKGIAMRLYSQESVVLIAMVLLLREAAPHSYW